VYLADFSLSNYSAASEILSEALAISRQKLGEDHPRDDASECVTTNNDAGDDDANPLIPRTVQPLMLLQRKQTG
jgi:hypothetical protein